jgi:SAM-dependent methyltransferase
MSRDIKEPNNRLMGGPICVGSGVCAVCGENTQYLLKKPGYSLRENYCSSCGASRRTRDLASVLLETLGLSADRSLGGQRNAFKDRKIFEAQASGVIHRIFHGMPGYVCAELIDGIAPGQKNLEGVRCENLQCLTFPDGLFDVVITQDVLEHVPDPLAAFREVARVLRPGGFHIFTVPIHEGRRTITRARIENGGERHFLEPVFHSDPLRRAGSLVYTDFGEDLPEFVKPSGMRTEFAKCTRFYNPRGIPWLADPVWIARYQEARTQGELLRCLQYNSIVVISYKGNPLIRKIAHDPALHDQSRQASVPAFSDAGIIERSIGDGDHARQSLDWGTSRGAKSGMILERPETASPLVCNVAKEEEPLYRILDVKPDNREARRLLRTRFVS